MAHHPIFARVYARLSPAMEQGGMAEHRERLVEGLRGSVIEVGAGNGLMFAHYPSAVTRVVAVEPDPYLRRLARAQADHAPVGVEVVDGVAEDLPADDASFDAAVASLVLCSVTDVQAALRELHRVVRPGGQLRYLEHVRADTPSLQRLQRLLDATLWPHVAGNCHTHRDTAAAIDAAGFAITHLDRFRFPPVRLPWPTAPHILGAASRPDGPRDGAAVEKT